MQVTISDNPDGTYTVAQGGETPAMEQQEGETPMPAPPMANGQPQGGGANGQTAQSLEEALQLVVRIFKAQQGGMKPSPFDAGMQQGLAGQA